jgi:hypothetical protein
MKYIITIIVNTKDRPGVIYDEQHVIDAFQAATCTMNTKAHLVQTAHVQRVKGEGMSTQLEVIQQLRPEDFSTWHERD